MRRWFPAFVTTLAALMCLTAPVCAQDAPKAKDKDASVLLAEPKTPTALFDAIVLMADLERPNLAQQYLEQLMAVELDDQTLLKIRDKHGPAQFLRLANDRRLHPQSVDLLEKMNAAFRRYAGDPARMDALIAQLKGNPEQREVAIIQLRSTGSVAVPRMLTTIAQTPNPQERDSLIYALTRLGKSIIPALIGALDSPAEQIRSVGIEALGWLGNDSVQPYLYYYAFSEKQSPGVRQTAKQALARLQRGDAKKAQDVSSFGASTQLEKLAISHFRNEYEWLLDDNNKVELWSWDRQANKLTSWIVDPKTASLLTGSHIARQALEMSPERERFQGLYLALRLAFDAHIAGPGKPLPSEPGSTMATAVEAGPEVALAALDVSLKHFNSPAALAALDVLSQNGSRRLLDNRNGQASPIIVALNAPSFAVQFAAASTILQFDPESQFRGSQRVVEVLRQALNDSGTRHALAIDPNGERGATTGSYLATMGYEPLTAESGQDGFKVAADRGDIALIAVHAACINWSLTQTIANIRADARTAGIPIVIYGPQSIEPKINRLLTDYPLVTFTTEGDASFKRGVELFFARLDQQGAAADNRGERIRAAGFWFAHIASGRRTEIFDLSSAEDALFEATAASEVGINGVIGLGAIATTGAQERLQEIATTVARPPKLREAAALQLALHIQKHGVLIPKEKVVAVKSAADAATEPDVRKALTAVLGSFKPVPQRVTELLNSIPDATLSKPEE